MATMFTPDSVRATLAALHRATAKVEGAAHIAENRGAEVKALHMKSRAPVDTGTLRDSIHVEGSSAVASAPYAIPVDKGTSIPTPAQPFAEDTPASHKGIEAAMVAVFRAALGGR